MAWRTVLSSVTRLLDGRMNATAMRWINRLSGAVLVGFGLIVVIGSD
jgi:threonine/homoserine/homoserine lactone efflux protein